MTVFDRLCIGTANWGPAPYGHRGVTCPRAEQEKIISYCLSAGIRTIDTAVAYQVDLSWVPTAFDIVMKVRAGNEVPKENYYCVMAHESSERGQIRLDPERHKYGSSVYDFREIVNSPDYPQLIQMPYSIFDRRNEFGLEYFGLRHVEIHVRSIFVQGKVFTSDEPIFVRFRDYARKVGLPVGTLCILFCLLNPHVDKVIIGVDSEQQLRDDLRLFHRLDTFGVDDPKIIDPRTFEKEQ